MCIRDSSSRQQPQRSPRQSILFNTFRPEVEEIKKIIEHLKRLQEERFCSEVSSRLIFSARIDKIERRFELVNCY